LKDACEETSASGQIAYWARHPDRDRAGKNVSRLTQESIDAKGAGLALKARDLSNLDFVRLRSPQGITQSSHHPCDAF
jgi:hypothetical protein